MAFMVTVSVMFTHVGWNTRGWLFIAFHHGNRSSRHFFIGQALFFEFESNPALV